MKKLILSLLVIASCSSPRSDLERSADVGFGEIVTDMRRYLDNHDAIAEARAIAIKMASELGQPTARFDAIPVLTDLQIEALNRKLAAYERLVDERLRKDTNQ